MNATARNLAGSDGAVVASDASGTLGGAAAPSGRDEEIAKLFSRAFLYEHPADYRSGVAATLEALRIATPDRRTS